MMYQSLKAHDRALWGKKHKAGWDALEKEFPSTQVHETYHGERADILMSLQGHTQDNLDGHQSYYLVQAHHQYGLDPTWRMRVKALLNWGSRSK